jgi:spore germination protein KB
MLQSKNQITVRQLMIMFCVSIFSPAIRLMPGIGSELGREAAWVSPILSSAVLFTLFLVLERLFKNKKSKDIIEVYDMVLGKFFSYPLRIFYLFWTFILYFLYIRYYAERLLTSIFRTTDIRFFILVMMIVVFMALRGKFETFARFCEISFLLFNLITIIFFILLIPSVRIENIYPLTHNDIVPALKSTYPVLGLWGYVTFFMLLGDNVKDKEQIKNHRRFFTLFLAIITSLMLIFIIGTLGHMTARRMPLPFFSVTKMIVFAESLDRLESILLSIWVVSDFIIITSFAFMIMNSMKDIFKISADKYLSFPVVLAGYFGSLFFTGSRFELEVFSEKIGLLVNIILGFAVPFIVFGIGKLRKKV